MPGLREHVKQDIERRIMILKAARKEIESAWIRIHELMDTCEKEDMTSLEWDLLFMASKIDLILIGIDEKIKDYEGWMEDMKKIWKGD